MAFFFYTPLRRLFRLQFGLKGLFIATTIAAVWTGIVIRRAREQQTAVRLIREQCGFVYYDFQEQPPGSSRYDSKAESDMPAWLLARFGEDFFSDVVYAQLGGHPMRDGEDKIPDAFQLIAIQHLPGLRKLRHLVFMDLGVTDEALRCVGELKSLESLQFFCDATKVTDAGVRHLAGLRNLKTLSLLDPAITDESLKTLARLRALERLELGGSQISDRGLVQLQGLKELRQLGLGRSGGISDQSMPSLSNLLHLEYLDLSEAHVTSAGLAQLKRLTALTHLDLSNNLDLDDDAMSVIRRFEGLEELRLDNTRVTSNGLERLVGLKKLRVLNVPGCKGVTDEGAGWLSQLAALQELNLRNTKVSSLAVKRLAALKKLRILDLSENAAIREDAAPYLDALVTLQELDLHQTNIRLTQESMGRIEGLAALKYFVLACSGSNCRTVEAALPTCFVVGSRASCLPRPGILEGKDYLALIGAIHRQNYYREAVKGTLGPTPDELIEHFMPPEEALPPKDTLERMILLAGTAELAPVFGEQRPVLKAFEKQLNQHPNQVNPLKEQAKRLLGLAQSDKSLRRLYTAAIDFQLSDAVVEFVEDLDGMRRDWALTDVEQAEHREASECLSKCLTEAGKQLMLMSETSTDGPEDGVLRVWKNTQHVATRANKVEAARR